MFFEMTSIQKIYLIYPSRNHLIFVTWYFFRISFKMILNWCIIGYQAKLMKKKSFDKDLNLFISGWNKLWQISYPFHKWMKTKIVISPFVINDDPVRSILPIRNYTLQFIFIVENLYYWYKFFNLQSATIPCNSYSWLKNYIIIDINSSTCGGA